MQTDFRTHYDNLQVKENASDEVIKGAYRYLSQKWHPDRNPETREEAERVLKIINQAYAVLSDPEKRKEHDAWIARQSQDGPRDHGVPGRESSPAPRPAGSESHESAGNSSAHSSYRHGPAPGAPLVPNHLVWAVLTTIFCCLPLGVVAIVKAVEVNSKLAAGDIAGARGASATAKTLVISAAIVGAIMIFFIFLDMATQSL